MSVKVRIDGIDYEAQEGKLLIDVCADNGIDVPHFCYHPGLGPDGNCRMCQVEFVTARGSRLGVSCKATVTDGMEVLTQSEQAKRARASVEEFLLLNHPLDCPICDKAGECTLQNYYMEHDLEDSRMDFTRHKKGKAMDIGPTLILDQERCVLCDRCVRFLRDVAGDPQLHIASRGHAAFITTFPGQEVTSAYSLNTVDLCPVGALTAKDFRFASANWFMKNTPTVCTTCSRGCSMQLQTRPDENRVVRFRPRHNAEVNGYWSCDGGRLDYHFVNENRITRPFVRTDDNIFECSQQEAIGSMRTALGLTPAGKVEGSGSAKAVLLASATCTLEELYLLKRIGNDLLSAPVFVARHIPDGVEDDLLRRADRHPNVRGAELLGLQVVDFTGDGPAANPVRDALGAQGVLVCVGFNRHVTPGVYAAVDHAARVIALSACETRLTEAADVVIPGLTWAEKDGLVVNFEGHVQRLKAGMHAEGVSEWKILDNFIASLTGSEAHEFVTHIRQAIGSSESAFAGVDLAKVGPHGTRATAQPVG